MDAEWQTENVETWCFHWGSDVLSCSDSLEPFFNRYIYIYNIVNHSLPQRCMVLQCFEADYKGS